MASQGESKKSKKEEEEEDKDTALSSAEKLAARGETAKPDQYGQVHPVETAELLKTSLEALTAELDGLPDDKEEKKAWLQATERCPELTGDNHKLLFLRCEVFEVKLAAARLLKYWTKRLSLFGESKAFLPLTLDKALVDDEAALATEFMRLTGQRDAGGRAILFVDPSKQDKTQYSRESFVRRLWYVIHAALEDDEETQRKGIVLIASPRHAKFSQVDHTQDRMNIDSMRGKLPVRIGAIHICHPPTFFAMIFPIVRMFMGSVLRKRVHVHSGSTDKVLKRLEKFGIVKSSVPTDLGGDLKLDYPAWLAERRADGK